MRVIRGFPSTSQDEFQLNVTTLIRHGARSFGSQQIIARKPDGQIFSYTFREAYERVKKVANLLKDLGIEPGERIGVLEWNTHRHFELYFGIPGTGAVLLQMNIRLMPQELIYIANHSEVKLIFVDESLIPIAEAISSEVKSIKAYIIMTDKKPNEIKTKLDPIYYYEELLSQKEPEYDWPMLDEKSAYSACYTSGTTGLPKGVYYSHRCIYLHSMQVAVSYEIKAKDCFLLLTPMYHATAWGMAQVATLVGAKLILPGRYTIEDFGPIVEIMENEKVTFTVAATTIFMSMLEYIKGMKKKPNFSNLKILSGASEPPLAMLRGFHELTGAEVKTGYGATETTPTVTVNKLKPWLEGKLSEEERWNLNRKHGYPVPGIDLKIVDEKNEELPHDGKAVGEILVRGPWITRCYYNAPGTESRFTEDGYWRSGDVGVIDHEEYLKMVDRIKDLIKSGGEWISSIDMENEIMRHPAVLEATVIGLSHPKWEERPVAFVVLKSDFKGKIIPGEILDHLHKVFSKWQLPDKVLFLDQIPKTSVGKFNKKLLKDKYKDLLGEN